MPLYKLDNKDLVPIEIKGKKTVLLTKEAHERFNISLLGLGNVQKEAETIDALAAVFDLGGFTNFCKQLEPHLSVPKFLSSYLEWILKEIQAAMTQEMRAEGVQMWSPPPFLLKFMGDGLLLLWNAKDLNPTGIRNVIVQTRDVCIKYWQEFYPTMARKVVEPPHELRCGVARGHTFSVGDGQDYVGSCINLAARLQKLPGLRFAFSTRGVDLDDPERAKYFKTKIVIAKVAIRGIGEKELIAFDKFAYDAMNAEDKKIYKIVHDCSADR